MATISTRHSEPALSRLWTPDPRGLLELWRHEGRRTLRTFGSFRDSDLGFRPQLGARTIAELFSHMIQSYWLTRHWLIFETATCMPEIAVAVSVDRAAGGLKEAQHELFATLEVVSAASFLVEI